MVCTYTSKVMGYQRELWEYIVDLVQVGKGQMPSMCMYVDHFSKQTHVLPTTF